MAGNQSPKSTRPIPMRRSRRLSSFAFKNTVLLPSDSPAKTARNKSSCNSAIFAQMNKKKSPNKKVSVGEVDKVQTRRQEQVVMKEVKKGRRKVPQLGLISRRAGRVKRGLDVQGREVEKTKRGGEKLSRRR